MYITHHAAAQYARRIRPDMTRECARAYLIAAVVRAESTGERTDLGHQIWRISDACLVTKHDPKYGDVVVTVLSPDMPRARAAALAEAVDEIVEAARRAGVGSRPPGRKQSAGRKRRARA